MGVKCMKCILYDSSTAKIARTIVLTAPCDNIHFYFTGTCSTML